MRRIPLTPHPEACRSAQLDFHSLKCYLLGRKWTMQPLAFRTRTTVGVGDSQELCCQGLPRDATRQNVIPNKQGVGR